MISVVNKAMATGQKKAAAFSAFIGAVKEDYASVAKNRAKYHAEHVTLWRLPIDLVRKVGFQTTTMIRIMQLGRDANIVGLAPLMSRMIRHVYGCEIHWDANIQPGISIVHGNGVVISHAATVGRGCILFHNVTLGEGLDKETRKRGAPVLEHDVHVGPNCVLLGPIVVGAHSKLAAGSILDQSVPPNSLISPAASSITSRRQGNPQ